MKANFIILSKRNSYSPSKLSLCVEKYPHLEFCNRIVVIVSNLVFHGAEVHRMFDDHWVTRSNCICYWKWEESMGIFPGKTSDAWCYSVQHQPLDLFRLVFSLLWSCQCLLFVRSIRSIRQLGHIIMSHTTFLQQQDLLSTNNNKRSNRLKTESLQPVEAPIFITPYNILYVGVAWNKQQMLI